VNLTGVDMVQVATDAIGALEAAASAAEADGYFEDRVVPRDLRQFLAGLRLLSGVPFAYLVPDSALLPPESIRFFYLDRAWADALVQGALSVGTVNSGDRAQLEQLHRPIRDEIDEEERRVRMPGSELVQQGPAGTITGFLLRSRAVSGWPGMHVRAYRTEVGDDDEIVPESHPDRLKVLRLERLAPAVLLALFDGVPQLVQLEEPRQGIQFGVRLDAVAGATNKFRAEVLARDVQTTEQLEPPAEVRVRFRKGAPGVLHLRKTAENLVTTPGTNMGADLDGAEFALQMLSFPYRQVFGDTSAGSVSPILDVFRPSLALTMDKLITKFGESIG
jgi:hypothetical protein